MFHKNILHFAHACDQRKMYRMADDAIKIASMMYRLANEWWLQSGNAIYADGDVGDANHEMIAEEEILNQMGFDLHYEEGPLTRDYANQIFQDSIGYLDEYNDYLANIHNHDEEAIENAHHEADLYEYLLWKQIKENPKADPNDLRQKLDEMWNGFRDPRTYALKNFGWHRVHGNRIEVFNLNKSVLEDVAQGLYDAYGEEADSMNFYIESHNPRKYLGPVSISEIESGSVLRSVLEPDSVSDLKTKRRSNSPYYKYEGD